MTDCVRFPVASRFWPPQDGRHGDAWGTLTWKGEEKKAMGRVRGTLKREWRYLPPGESMCDK